MTMYDRNTSLSNEERKLYTERLLKLHRIIADDIEQTEYYHPRWVTVSHTCGTAACAMGHAMVHADEFPGLENYLDHSPLDHGAHVRFNTFKNYDVIGACGYFGPGALEHIFAADAYSNIGLPASEVTRQRALERIEIHIKEYLGCKLIEEKINEPVV